MHYFLSHTKYKSDIAFCILSKALHRSSALTSDHNHDALDLLQDDERPSCSCRRVTILVSVGGSSTACETSIAS
jgi:hypothetical protein